MIRYATPADRAAIRGVVEAAFGGAEEAQLVERLRAADDAIFELVAEQDGEVVGHIMFSRLWADRDEVYAALAPLAVEPGRQRAGLGAQLVRAGLDSARQVGAFGVLVLGEPGYYGRFGFSAEITRNVTAPYRGLPAFMGLALEAGAFEGPITVAYPDAFTA